MVDTGLLRFGGWIGVGSGDIELVGMDCLGLARLIVPVSPTRGLGGGGSDTSDRVDPDKSELSQSGISPGAGGGGSESRDKFDRNISGGGGGRGSLSDSTSSITRDGERGGGNEVIESIMLGAIGLVGVFGSESVRV